METPKTGRLLQWFTAMTHQLERRNGKLEVPDEIDQGEYYNSANKGIWKHLHALNGWFLDTDEQLPINTCGFCQKTILDEEEISCTVELESPKVDLFGIHARAHKSCYEDAEDAKEAERVANLGESTITLNEFKHEIRRVEELRSLKLCAWLEPWRGFDCRKPAPDGFCEEHSKQKCIICGGQATHGCSHSVSLVCGQPLCDLHGCDRHS